MCVNIISQKQCPQTTFSINKILLDAHRHSIKEDKIVVLRFVKDKPHSIGGATKFIKNRNLIESCKAAHAKSVADEEKKLIEREKKKQKGWPKQQEKKRAAGQEKRT